MTEQQHDEHEKPGPRSEREESEHADLDPIRREEREQQRQLEERELVQAEISAWGHA